MGSTVAAAATGFLKIDVTAQYKHHHAYHENCPSSEPLRGLFVGQLEEDSPGEDDADAGPHGGAHEAEDQLDVRDEDADSEADEDQTDGDQIESGRGNVVSDQLSGADTLVGLPEQEAVDTGPAGEHHQGERERHGDAETHLQHLDEFGVLKVCQNVSAHITGVEGDVAKEPDGDIYESADIDSSLRDLGHLSRSGVWETSVHFEYIRLTRKSHGEDGEALEHSTRPPKIDLRHPLS